MKRVFSLLFAILIVGFGATNAFADADEPGSSTFPDELKGIPSSDFEKVTLENVHSGKTVNISAKAFATDAVGDNHPFTE